MEGREARPGIALTAHLMPGAYVGPDVMVQDSVLIGPNAAVLGAGEGGGSPTIIMAGAEVGANATVLGSVTVGFRARVAPGSVVTRTVPPLAIVAGNPAHITGYVETSSGMALSTSNASQRVQSGKEATGVRGVTLHGFRMVVDMRGNLTVGEFEKEVPFTPRRYFLVLDVPSAETRGEHAHLRCKQFLIAVRGTVNVVADDGTAREEFVLDTPHTGLYVPEMTWCIQYRYSAEAVLLVFASEWYDANDYVRDYADFLERVRR